ncbi:MAG TPA: prepilin-type N-terminal cleavage/methylation domain-containing protein [Phycisphaerales bacterium]|nr:prepilin-type N-terminal cleavage/methylation domain-containing protein [Phycisphaerales bacterium]
MLSGTSSGGDRGFTLVELLAVLVAVAVLIVTTALSGCCLPALGKARASARQLKCSTQVRGIAQAMIVWASNNQSLYPLPSSLDTANATVAAGPPRSKDTTANILSVMIYNGSISPEICVCSGETNPKISAHAAYMYSSPPTAPSPNNALWDPSFSADFSTGNANNSYAHLQPSGVQMPENQVPDYTGAAPESPDPKKTKLVWTGRMTMWQDTYNSTEAIFGDRAPEITASAPTIKTRIAISNSLGLHGGPSTWEGNIGYNDNHVSFETTLSPTAGFAMHTYTNKAGKKTPDVAHFDEADDALAINTFLGIFTTAGEQPSAFKGIWD